MDSVGPRNHVLHRGPDPHTRRGNFECEKGPAQDMSGHCDFIFFALYKYSYLLTYLLIYPAVNILKATHYSAKGSTGTVRMPIGTYWVHIGAT